MAGFSSYSPQAAALMAAACPARRLFRLGRKRPAHPPGDRRAHQWRGGGGDLRLPFASLTFDGVAVTSPRIRLVPQGNFTGDRDANIVIG